MTKILLRGTATILTSKKKKTTWLREQASVFASVIPLWLSLSQTLTCLHTGAAAARAQAQAPNRMFPCSSPLMAIR